MLKHLKIIDREDKLRRILEKLRENKVRIRCRSYKEVEFLIKKLNTYTCHDFKVEVENSILEHGYFMEGYWSYCTGICEDCSHHNCGYPNIIFIDFDDVAILFRDDKLKRILDGTNQL